MIARLKYPESPEKAPGNRQRENHLHKVEYFSHILNTPQPARLSTACRVCFFQTLAQPAPNQG